LARPSRFLFFARPVYPRRVDGRGEETRTGAPSRAPTPALRRPRCTCGRAPGYPRSCSSYGGAAVSATMTSWVPRGAYQTQRLRPSTRRTWARTITPRSSGATSVVTSPGTGKTSAAATCKMALAMARDASEPPTTPSWAALLKYRGESAIVRRATGSRALAARQSSPRSRPHRP
jgi:hypothetical protein